MHLVSRPPLCSQLPWHMFHNSYFCQCDRASHSREFSSRDWARPPTWAGLEQGSGPWTAGRLFRQSPGTGAGAMLEDDPHLSQTFVQATSRPHFISASEYIQWSLSGAEQSKDVRFVLFAMGGLKPEGSSTSPCVNKVRQSPCLAGLTSAWQALAQPCEEPFQIHQSYFFLYWRYSHTCLCLYCFSEAYQHSVANIAFHHNVLSDEKGAVDWLGLSWTGGRRFLADASGGGILWSNGLVPCLSWNRVDAHHNSLGSFVSASLWQKTSTHISQIIALFNKTWPLSCSSFFNCSYWGQTRLRVGWAGFSAVFAQTCGMKCC